MNRNVARLDDDVEERTAIEVIDLRDRPDRPLSSRALVTVSRFMPMARFVCAVAVSLAAVMVAAAALAWVLGRK